MAKVTTYDNSKLATCFSFLGYMGIILGVYCCFEDEIGIGIGIVIVAIGFALKLLAGFINKKKIEKQAKRNKNA